MRGTVYVFQLTENNTSLRLDYGVREVTFLDGGSMFRVSPNLVGIYKRVR
jgi:hypothetical protein